MLKPTPAGQLDRRLIFYGATISETSRGGMAKSKGAVLAKAWGRVSYGTGSERREAGLENTRTAATARIRANSQTRQINSESLCELDGVTWDVTGSVPYGRGELDITMTRRNT